jgi:hypothetical protein
MFRAFISALLTLMPFSLLSGNFVDGAGQVTGRE